MGMFLPYGIWLWFNFGCRLYRFTIWQPKNGIVGVAASLNLIAYSTGGNASGNTNSPNSVSGGSWFKWFN